LLLSGRGVDVGIAVDLVVDKILNSPDEAVLQVLISSDADLIPTIETVRGTDGGGRAYWV